MIGRLGGIGDEAAAEAGGQIDVLHSLGWNGIELRTVDGVAIADLDEGAFDALATAIRTAELDVICIDSRIGSWARSADTPFSVDLAELDRLVGRCHVLGTSHIRIMSYPGEGLSQHAWRRRAVDRIRRLAERAWKDGIVLLHENCTGWAADSAERAMWLLEAVNHPGLGLLFDTGNGVADGYEAADLLSEIAPRVEHVHVKDGAPGPEGPIWTNPGDGRAGVAECLSVLAEHGYTGWLSLEPHLAIQPHRGDVRASEGAAARFVEAARSLERLLARGAW